MEEVESRWRGEFRFPHGELIMIVIGELSIVEFLIHVGIGDQIVEEIDENEIGYIDDEE